MKREKSLPCVRMQPAPKNYRRRRRRRRLIYIFYINILPSKNIHRTHVRMAEGKSKTYACMMVSNPS